MVVVPCSGLDPSVGALLDTTVEMTLGLTVGVTLGLAVGITMVPDKVGSGCNTVIGGIVIDIGGIVIDFVIGTVVGGCKYDGGGFGKGIGSNNGGRSKLTDGDKVATKLGDKVNSWPACPGTNSTRPY